MRKKLKSHKPKVLLLNLPANGLVHRDVGCSYTSKSNYYYPQADLFMMAANVSKISSQEYLDAIIDNINEDELFQKIKAYNPNHIFTIVSSITEDNDLRLLRKIKEKFPLIKIWATGDLIYYTNNIYPCIDVQVKDFTNHNEILKLFKNENFSKTNIINVSNDRVFKIGICPHHFAKNKKYHNPYSLYAPVAMILTNWGCPFRCSFCAARNLQGEDGKYKHRDTIEVLEEIKYALSLGFKEIYFRDFTFAIPRTEKLLDLIIDSKLNFKWSCATRVDVVNEKILIKMKKAGCYLIFYGVDGAEQNILNSINKDLRIEEVEKKVKLTKKIGIETLCSFIVGFKDENQLRTKKFIDKVNPDYLAVSILSATYGSNLRSQDNLWEQNILENNINDSTYSDNDDLVNFRNSLEKSFYLKPRRIISYFLLSIKGPRRFLIFMKSGFGLIHKWLISPLLKTKKVSGKNRIDA
ncbi:radical SAM protein [Methylophilaceae bacterium]|nr:radical SAM protein [Methylophilaceae bacterium]